METFDLPLNLQEYRLRFVKKEGKLVIETTWGAEKRGEVIEKDFIRSGENIIFGKGRGNDSHSVRINLSEEEDNVHFDDGLGYHGCGVYATLLIDRAKVLNFIQ